MSSIDSISSLPLDNSTLLNAQKAPNPSVSLQASQVNVSRSQTADITIVTAEGDTVTLSSSKSTELSFATYNAQGQVGDASGSATGVSAQIQRTSAFSITVEGDLNKEEMKEIRKAIRIIERTAHDILTGQTDKAAAQTAKLSNLDQLASISADLEFQREVSVTQVSAQSDAAAPDSSSTTTPSVPVPAPVSAPETQQTNSDLPVAAPLDTAAAPAATVTSATASTHLTVLIQTQTNPASNTLDASKSAPWWAPSPDIWNMLHPKNSPLTPTPDSTTPTAA